MRGSLLSRLNDWFVLCPTTHPIEVLDRQRRWVPFETGRIEVWTHRVPADPARDPDVFVLKFPGTGGRAEMSTDQPAGLWPDAVAELWTVNPPGYGGSTGPASLHKMAPAGRAVLADLQAEARGRPIVVFGNSLGCATALHVATQPGIAALVLRNPPPLRELLIGRYGWWNLYLGTWLMSRQLPPELDCLANARRLTIPAVFIMSNRDRLVPPRYQQRIHQAYAGQKRILELAEADHATPMTKEQWDEYGRHLAWLWDAISRPGSD